MENVQIRILGEDLGALVALVGLYSGVDTNVGL
jgi:hypothetical protein